MDTVLLFLLLCSLLSFSSSFSSAVGRCHPIDYKVLMDIKTSLYTPDHFDTWIPNTDCCSMWEGIECNEKSNRVISLRVSPTYSSGQIPPVIGDLSYLQVLEFVNSPNLSSSIPLTIAKLKQLRALRITWTNVTGAVPYFLSELYNLNSIDLSFNKLSGPIPRSISKLTKLDILHLEGNKLTGPIPNSFGRFTELSELHLSDNQLSGPIPNSLANMNFKRIDLSSNKLVGDASMLFNPNGNALDIDLSRNMLEFDLSKVRFQKNLISLHLDHNKIYGSIPKSVAGLKNLMFFTVGYNKLCGEIPRGGNLWKFDSFSYTHNRCLCGPPLIKCKN